MFKKKTPMFNPDKIVFEEFSPHQPFLFLLSNLCHLYHDEPTKNKQQILQ
jgi:hypothetical protein